MQFLLLCNPIRLLQNRPSVALILTVSSVGVIFDPQLLQILPRPLIAWLVFVGECFRGYNFILHLLPCFFVTRTTLRPLVLRSDCNHHHLSMHFGGLSIQFHFVSDPLFFTPVGWMQLCCLHICTVSVNNKSRKFNN